MELIKTIVIANLFLANFPGDLNLPPLSLIISFLILISVASFFVHVYIKKSKSKKKKQGVERLKTKEIFVKTFPNRDVVEFQLNEPTKNHKKLAIGLMSLCGIIGGNPETGLPYCMEADHNYKFSLQKEGILRWASLKVPIKKEFEKYYKCQIIFTGEWERLS